MWYRDRGSACYHELPRHNSNTRSFAAI